MLFLFCVDDPSVDTVLQKVLERFCLGEGFDLIDKKTGEQVGDFFSFFEARVQEEFPWICLEWVKKDPWTLKVDRIREELSSWRAQTLVILKELKTFSSKDLLSCLRFATQRYNPSNQCLL